MSTISNHHPFARPVIRHVAANPPVVKLSKPPRSTSKRARSPEPPHDITLAQQASKRARCNSTTAPPVAGRGDKESRQAEREQKETEFKEKYSRAFPSWTFHFDLDHLNSASGTLKDFKTRIHHLGGSVEDFFSNQVTHLVTDQQGATGEVSNKENSKKSRGASAKIPRVVEDAGAGAFGLTAKALSFGIKVWTTTKLDSVLSRCIDTPMAPKAPTPAARVSQQGASHSLSRLLHSERIHGTSERDPSQKRHDFRYFARGSHFLLIEDFNQKLATIAAHEYILPKPRDGKPSKVPWPVLHYHPTRGPFAAFDEKEKKRWEKDKLAEKEQSRKTEKTTQLLRIEALRRKAEGTLPGKNAGDLRRSVSMHNLHKTAAKQVADTKIHDLESNPASGYLASAGPGYLAASGNSAGITSATGTTSTASYVPRTALLPSALRERQNHEVVTSHKVLAHSKTGVTKLGKEPVLKKSRSTNTMRLPKREGTKPSHCENCRVKIDDFKAHVSGKTHQQYAHDDQKFAKLDDVLAGVQRRTMREVQEKERRWRERRAAYCSSPHEAMQSEASSSPTKVDTDFQVDEMACHDHISDY
ncbi:hypothetical protein BDN72DRAFT_836756 [Pluteus cervinus]|uniref:Uncharacterized protein n=1 Tax=Pluteus cervinus TaxID=181527 RepID=A0ACD3B2Y6_9AGAR|nr:hypothetical protein BDN72DRAFT_836756 [Pluteus cervinus]